MPHLCKRCCAPLQVGHSPGAAHPGGLGPALQDAIEVRLQCANRHPQRLQAPHPLLLRASIKIYRIGSQETVSSRSTLPHIPTRKRSLPFRALPRDRPSAPRSCATAKRVPSSPTATLPGVGAERGSCSRLTRWGSAQARLGDGDVPGAAAPKARPDGARISGP